MATFSMITAVVTALFVSLFSGFPGLLPVLLFFILLLINCECTAANLYEDEKNSTLFMAVISSSLVVLLCIVIVSSNLNNYFCDKGLMDPDKVHPLIPFLTILTVTGFFLFFRHRAKSEKLLVQKYGSSLKSSIDRHTYNPDLERYRKIMIREGILTERMPDDEKE